MNSKTTESIRIGYLITLLLCLTFIVAPFHKALAAESEEERVAKLVEGAKKEGKLLLYTTMSVVEAEALMKRFNEKYPFIETGVYRTDPDGMMTRITTESQAKKYLFDLVHLGTGLKDEIVRRKGFTVKYLSPQRQFYPEVFKDPEGYWTDMYVNFNVLGYNTNLVSSRDAPKTYEDLLNSKWKGKMGMDTASDDWFASMLKMMGEKKGLEYMKQLAKQDIQLRTGRTLNTQMVASGELSLAIPLYNHRVEEMKRKGSPVEWIALEPVIPEENPIAISAHAPHPNAAKLFVDFVLSREAQQMFAGFYRIPARADVDAQVPELKLKGRKIWPVDLSIADDYEKYVKLFLETFMKKP